MITIEYLPKQENGFADALSREERERERPESTKDGNEVDVRESQETGDSSRTGGCGGTTSTKD